MARNSDDAHDAHNASRRGESIDPHTASVDVESDRMLADTDDDGLADGREHDLGTDPELVDTDTDSIADARELDVGEDPTLHDFSPPTVHVRAIEVGLVADPSGSEFGGVFFNVTYQVEDPSGVSKVRLFTRSVLADSPDRTSAVRRFDGQQRTQTVEDMVVTSDENALNRALYIGPKVHFRAVDVHGNDRTRIKRDSSSFARLAKILPGYNRAYKQEFGSRLTARHVAATLSGFIYSVGRSVVDLLELLNNLERVFDIIEVALLLLFQPQLAGRLPQLVVEQVVRAQQVQNPFGPGRPTANTTFATGWYTGYVGAFIAEVVVGEVAAARAVDVVTDVSTRANRFLDAYRSTKAAIGDTAFSVPSRTALRVGRTVAASADVGGGAVRRALADLPTPRQVAVRDRLLEVSGDRLTTVFEADLETELVTYLSVTGDSGLRALRRVDGGDLRELLDRFGETPELGEALARRGVPIEKLESNLDSIDLSGSAARRFFGFDDGLAYTLVRGKFTSRFENLRVGIRHVRDRDALIEKYVEDAPTPELRKGSVAEGVADDIADEKGYDVIEEGFEKSDTSDIGIDRIARNDEGEFVMIEAKYTSNERIGFDLVETDAYGANAQLDREWLLGAIEEMDDRGILTDESLIDELETAVRNENVRRELHVVRDAGLPGGILRRPQSLARSLSARVDIDAVEIVDLPPGAGGFSIGPASRTIELQPEPIPVTGPGSVVSMSTVQTTEIERIDHGDKFQSGPSSPWNFEIATSRRKYEW